MSRQLLPLLPLLLLDDQLAGWPRLECLSLGNLRKPMAGWLVGWLAPPGMSIPGPTQGAAGWLAGWLAGPGPPPGAATVNTSGKLVPV